MTRLNVPLVYFKAIHSGIRRQYPVDSKWSIDNFINIMKTRIIRDFHIEQFELVEAGQNTVSGRLEDGIALNRGEQTPLREKYGENMNVAFYIRPINYTSLVENTRTRTRTRTETRTETRTNTSTISECVVCFEQLPSFCYYECGHPMCQTCLTGCLQNNIRCCPVCRCPTVAV
jgi:hypothetical protein